MRIHFIAIGGSVMHDLAISLAKHGHQVTGSDDQIVEPSKTDLLSAGLYPDRLGWDPDRITDELEAVILGAHAKPDNPELLKAQELGLSIYSFPEFVHMLCRDKTRVVIAGTYGKTTIISMIMHVLRDLGKSFDYLVGAQLSGFERLVDISKTNKIVIIEGDEKVASQVDQKPKFLFYEPNIALISGVHWNQYTNKISKEDYFSLFEEFVRTIPEKGTLVYNKESEELSEIINRTKDCRINRHGYKLPEYKINKGVTYIEGFDGDIPLEVFGKYNLSNISGAYTVCEWLGIKKNDFFDSIRSFRSSIRYLEFLGSSDDGSVVYQEFIKSPSKLKESIHIVKEQFSWQQLVTVLEMNTYECLNENFMESFRNSMIESDVAVIYFNVNACKDNTLNINVLQEKLRIDFNRPDLIIINNLDELNSFVESLDSTGKNLLLVSSNQYGGLNLQQLADRFIQ